MYHSFLIHSPAHGHLGGFHVLAIKNSAVMNIGVHVSLSILVSSVCMLSSGIAGSSDQISRSAVSDSLRPHESQHGSRIAEALYHASNLDWQFISHMIFYMFQCYPPISSPLPFPQSPKDCSIHLCLFCYLTYRLIITIFLNSIYMC